MEVYISSDLFTSSVILQLLKEVEDIMEPAAFSVHSPKNEIAHMTEETNTIIIPSPGKCSFHLLYFFFLFKYLRL